MLTNEQIDELGHRFKCAGSNLWTEDVLRKLFHKQVDELCAQAKLANVSAAGGAEPVANGWKYQIQTGYIHQGCGACWQVHFNDTGLYALCPSCDERRSIDPTFPPIVYAHSSVAGMPSEPTVAVPVGESRWLIERTYAKGYPAERQEFWLGVTDEGVYHDSFGSNNKVWTTNAVDAARFSSEKIAQKLRYEHFHPEAPLEVCEHIFQCGVSV